ncbi:MAG: hypothetical protein DME18_05685, partial [Verrucomicrobia bacterium]
MAQRNFKLLNPLLIGCALALLAVIGWEMIELNELPSRGPPPNPNGYDDFVKAGNLLAGEPSSYQSICLPRLETLLSANEDVRARVRQGLTRKCRVPDHYSSGNFDSHLTELSILKQIAQLLTAEGRLAELEHRTNDAIRAYLDTVRFGTECCRGGVIIDKLVGIAIEAIGTGALEKLIEGLEVKSCRAIVQELQQIDRATESVADIMRNERTWVFRNYSLAVRLLSTVPFAALNPAKSSERKF